MKKKIIHGLLALMAVASTEMFADTISKTYMNDRGALSNNCLISKTGIRVRKKDKDAVGAHVAVSAFYRQSLSGSTKLANYFGDGTAAAPAGAITVTSSEATGLTSTEVDIARAITGTTTLNPRRIEAGAQLEWHQSLNKLVEGAWMCVAAPVEYVRTEMRATHSDATLGTYLDGSLTKTITNFGGSSSTTATQDALAKQVISGTYNSVTQVADVSVALGYNFLKGKGYKVGASVHGLIPTGNKPAGLLAFEPVAGNRSFFVGAGLHARANVWKSEDKQTKIGVSGCAKYSYGFSADQIRTLGMKNITKGAVLDGQYSLVGDVGTSHYMPLANVSTLTVGVKPQSRVEATASVNFAYDRFRASASYNLFWAQKESLTLKGAFDETNYGAKEGNGTSSYNSTISATTNGTYYGITNGLILATSPIVANALDLAAATTPAQVTHKVGGDLGYVFDTKVPVVVSAGGDVNLSSNNNSINSWSVFAKLGFSF